MAPLGLGVGFYELGPTLEQGGKVWDPAFLGDARILHWYKFNKDIIPKMDMDINNPVYEIIGNVVSSTTNVPLDRLVNKTNNVKTALEQDIATWQRIALFLGRNRLDLDIKDVDKVEAKKVVKQEKKKKKKIEEKIKQNIKNEEKEQEIQTQIEEEVKEQEEAIEKGEEPKIPICVAIKSSGERCKNEVSAVGERCTIHEKTEQRTDGKETQCTKIKSNDKRCKMKTSNKSGLCYYHD